MSAEDRLEKALVNFLAAVEDLGFECAGDVLMSAEDDFTGWRETLTDQVRSAVRATEALHEGRHVVRIDAPGGERTTFETAAKADVDAVYAALSARLAEKSGRT